MTFFQVIARLKNGEYLFHLGQPRTDEQGIAMRLANEFAEKPKWAAKGYYAVILDPDGRIIYDTRIDLAAGKA
jgi:hypothetical protein